MEVEQEGPKEVIVPEQRYMSCCGCVYYKRQMMKSGMNPVYESRCMHMDRGAYGKKLSDWMGRMETPPDCPVITKEGG